MWDFLRSLAASITGARPAAKRSPSWPKARAEHLRLEPACQVCGRKDRLEVHHLLPVHVRPDLELSPANLITLCDPGDGGDHLRFGHLYSWSSWNPECVEDCEVWRRKVANRPDLHRQE